MEKLKPKIDLDEAATALFEMLWEQDPTWQDRDQSCADEQGLSPGQRMLKYVAIVLDQGLHLNLLEGYSFVEPGISKPGEYMVPMHGECPQCHKEFGRKFPGQVCCSNECGEAYFPKPSQKGPDYGPAFENFESRPALVEVPPSDAELNARHQSSIPASGGIR